MESAFQAAISYAHGAFDERVRQLADRLNREGIDCELDQYEDAPAQGWPQWMLETMANRVILVICTREYQERVRLTSESGVGRGVAWEGRLLKGRIYNDQGRNEGIVPVVFRAEDSHLIPDFLRDVTYYDLSSSDGYERLYRRLTRQPKYVKPPLGSIRVYPPENLHESFTPVPPEGPQRTEPRRPFRVDMMRVGVGIHADALQFSHIGAIVKPAFDSGTIEMFDSNDDKEIAAFINRFPNCAGLRCHEVPEGVIMSDSDEPVQRLGVSENVIHIAVDGSVAVRFRLVGAHFLYDVIRTLASIYAISKFLAETYKTASHSSGRFGYRLIEAPYPRQISGDPYEAPFSMNVRDGFSQSMSAAVLLWARTAWPIGLSRDEVKVELGKVWRREFEPVVG